MNVIGATIRLVISSSASAVVRDIGKRDVSDGNLFFWLIRVVSLGRDHSVRDKIYCRCYIRIPVLSYHRGFIVVLEINLGVSVNMRAQMRSAEPTTS